MLVLLCQTDAVICTFQVKVCWQWCRCRLQRHSVIHIQSILHAMVLEENRMLALVCSPRPYTTHMHISTFHSFIHSFISSFLNFKHLWIFFCKTSGFVKLPFSDTKYNGGSVSVTEHVRLLIWLCYISLSLSVSRPASAQPHLTAPKARLKWSSKSLKWSV